jgi:hypothetical protein
MAPVLEGKSIGLDQKTMLKGELLIWRTKSQARDQGRESNSRIQFASNQFKLIPRILDPGPLSKVGLKFFLSSYSYLRYLYCMHKLLEL